MNQEKQLCYKEFLPRSPAESLTAILKGSRATRARVNSEALLLVGIDAPINVFWGKLAGGHEYLFTALAPGQGISDWLHDTDFPGNPEQLKLRRRLLTALGTFIGRMHACGFIHGNLTPDNVLVTLTHERFRFTLIDNERNIHKNPPPGKMLLRNLTQLNLLSPTELSRTDRMRFFLAWRRQMRDVSPVEGKILAAEAYQGAMRLLYGSSSSAAAHD